MHSLQDIAFCFSEKNISLWKTVKYFLIKTALGIYQASQVAQW